MKVLLVEDSPDDARLITRTLTRSGFQFDFTEVESEDALRNALMQTRFRLAITDHKLRGFDSIGVLAVIRELAPDMPCILVSGKVGEEAVAEAMRQGAAEFVGKENLDRLPPTVERTLISVERKNDKSKSDAKLRRSGKLFESVFIGATDAIFIFDDERKLIDANPAAEKMIGETKPATVGMSVEQFAPGIVPADKITAWPSLNGNGDLRGETEVFSQGGEKIRAEFTVSAGNLPGRYLMVMRDIRTRHDADMKVKRHMSQQKAIADLSTQALRGEGIDRLFESVAERVAQVLDAEVAAILELRMDHDRFVIKSAVGLKNVDKGDEKPFLPKTRSQFSYTVGEDEVVLVDDVSLERRFDPDGNLSLGLAKSGISVEIPGPNGPFGVLGSASSRTFAFNADDGAFLTAAANLVADALARENHEELTRRMALHDPLTGLANRTLLLARLKEALSRTTKTGPQLAVVSIDLDDFKSMNDTFGHRAGDQLLIQVGDRIRETVREGDTVARFGGDEFVVLYLDVEGDEEAGLLADRLLASLKAPFTFGAERCITSASLGIALSDDGNLDEERLLHDADIALYLSKDRGRATWTIANPEMRAGVIERSDTKQALELALGTDQLYLDYQPIVDLRTGELTGVEALARWLHPTRGLIPPETFIPIAESSGLILSVGEWALREACAQAVAWREEFGAGSVKSLNINVSARQVAQMDLTGLMKEVLHETGALPGEISLEITESVLIDNFGTPQETLADLRGMGMRVVLDDFGTGYSSLSYLDRFQIDTLKIDRSFVATLGITETPMPVVTAIIGMARALGIVTVAEGVETAEQAAEATFMGCRLAQGYFYSRPDSAAAISSLLLDGTPLMERLREVAENGASGVTGS